MRRLPQGGLPRRSRNALRSPWSQARVNRCCLYGVPGTKELHRNAKPACLLLCQLVCGEALPEYSRIPFVYTQCSLALQLGTCVFFLQRWSME